MVYTALWRTSPIACACHHSAVVCLLSQASGLVASRCRPRHSSAMWASLLTRHASLLPLQQYMEANLSAHQLSQVHEAWQRFVRGSQAAEQRRAQSTAVLHQAAAQQCVSWQKQSTQPSGGSTAERADVRGGGQLGWGCSLPNLRWGGAATWLNPAWRPALRAAGAGLLALNLVAPCPFAHRCPPCSGATCNISTAPGHSQSLPCAGFLLHG